jgi:hypothetical protein
MDNVILSLPQVLEAYSLGEPAVRRWVAEGILQPVRREGRGRGGRLYFSRYEVESLLYAVCPVCGERFKRGTLKARYCSQSCRQRAARIRGGSHVGE